MTIVESSNPLTCYNIYKITNKDDNRCYIGSTKYDIMKRFKRHKYTAKCGSRCMTKSFNFDNCDVICLEQIKTNDLNSVRWRERYYIENTECVNVAKPMITPRERQEMLLRHKERYAEKIECACGKTFRRDSQYRHNLSKQHLKYLNNITQHNE